jgi:hypothetical protein
VKKTSHTWIQTGYSIYKTVSPGKKCHQDFKFKTIIRQRWQDIDMGIPDKAIHQGIIRIGDYINVFEADCLVPDRLQGILTGNDAPVRYGGKHF